MKKIFTKIANFFKTSDLSPWVIACLILGCAVILGIILNNTVEVKW